MLLMCAIGWEQEYNVNRTESAAGVDEGISGISLFYMHTNYFLFNIYSKYK